MLSGSAATPRRSSSAPGARGAGQGALEQAQRLRDGVPSEAEVLRLAAQSGGPDPAARRDQPESAPPRRQQLLRDYTPASYPGYGYGWYPGYGYGFFNYGGSFVTGILAGELLANAFDPYGRRRRLRRLRRLRRRAYEYARLRPGLPAGVRPGAGPRLRHATPAMPPTPAYWHRPRVRHRSWAVQRPGLRHGQLERDDSAASTRAVSTPVAGTPAAAGRTVWRCAVRVNHTGETSTGKPLKDFRRSDRMTRV